MCFNDEQVARVIADCPVPVVTGIGHEPDVTIADMVADRRCSTPTAAAESVAPAIDEVERQKLAKLQEFQTQGAICAQQAEDAKTKIMVAAEDARQEELANRRRDAQQKQFEKEQILAEVASLNASELALVEIQQWIYNQSSICGVGRSNSRVWRRAARRF